MVKVRIPMMVDDARFAPLGRPEAIEGVDLEEAWYVALHHAIARH